MLANRPIDGSWFPKGEDKPEFEKMLRSSLALRQLKQILNDLESEFDRKEVKSDIYDSPSWAYKQADNIGYRRMLNQMKGLLSFIEL